MLGLKIENKLSLPLVMKKKMDASFTVRYSPLVLEKTFTFKWNDGSLECSYIIEIQNKNISEKIKNISFQVEDDGLIEYL